MICCSGAFEAMNNTTLLTADRATYMKIVVMALVASIVVIVVAITVHISPDDQSAQVQAAGPPVKAGKPHVVSQGNTVVIR
jgi:hypothetical protein